MGHYALVIEPPINLRRLRKGGRKPTAGDFFAMGLPDGEFVFGRVIDGPLERSRAPMPGAYLIYVYAHRSAEPSLDLDALVPSNLLFAPAFVNQLGWTKGYFLPVGSMPVSVEDRLPRHCFRRHNGTFLDEQGNLLDAPVEPCGNWGLGNHRSLDDRISEALGIPPAPIQ